jgi:acyl-CoA reductase-like NAD-dependent aldehyde dehydrogenase
MAKPALQVLPGAESIDAALADLDGQKHAWARTTNAQRIAMLAEIKDCLMAVAEQWAETAAAKKRIPLGSPLAGEEWISGPYAVMSGCNLFIETLTKMEGLAYLQQLKLRDLPNGQVAARVVPHSIWDQLLLSGVKADVWMQPGVTRANLASNTASGYDDPPNARQGRVSLVLGAGNIAAIAPLDCFQKLFVENQVVILKMNPVNDYLTEFLVAALRPLIAFGALRIVGGGADVGDYLCNHPLVEEIHITGAEASHDAIVWGVGDEARHNKRMGTPKNKRRITSELGAVCPTIVVPGPWTKADIAFQAEQVATQKLHNSGFNCVACQMLIMPQGWNQTEPLLEAIEKTIQSAPSRPLYYPGAADRMQAFQAHTKAARRIVRQNAPDCVVVPVRGAGNDNYFEKTEVFAPALSVMRIDGKDPESYLKAAIAYANTKLHGTLGANILIHPATLRAIGRQRFEAIIAELRYGCIAVNAWTGLGFLLVQTPWGAFPGHRLDDVGSGIGTVHNTFMFDKPERTVVEAPFRPFPRNLLSFQFWLLPRPPWFVTNKKAHVVGRLLTAFQYRPSLMKLPRIFLNALMG